MERPARPHLLYGAIALTLLTAVKVLLIPAYRSTDFDVHRNWLAVTRQLPLSEWYFDDVNGTTVHTLDYPPLFAFFEAALSHNPVTDALLRSGLLDERCLALLGDDDNEPSARCVLFQRLTVIGSDSVLIVGAVFASFAVLARSGGSGGNEEGEGQRRRDDSDRALIAAFLIVANPGLLMLDHVHFQYNGMMLGLLLLSVGCVAHGAGAGVLPGAAVLWELLAAILFAALLAMKHLYLTLAPLYLVYLLRHHCFLRHAASSHSLKFSFGRFVILALVTLVGFSLPFIPFLLQADPRGQLHQMFRRMFPFGRGLVHDYWAANVWALYLCADKCLTFALRRVAWAKPFLFDMVPMPDVPPSVSALCLLCGLGPALICAWKAASALLQPGEVVSEQLNREMRCRGFFVQAVVFCSFTGFMLAYHVHEKAIMTAIIPMTILATMSQEHARLYLRTSALGHFGLLPLLYRPAELAVKVTIYVVFLSLSVFLLEYATSNIPSAKVSLANKEGGNIDGLLTWWDKIGLAMLVLLLVFMEVIHPLVFKPKDKLEFLPLMATSVVCAVGLVWCWIQSGLLMFRNARQLSMPIDDKKKQQ